MDMRGALNHMGTAPLQHAAAVMRVALDRGGDIASALAAVEAVIAGRIAPVVRSRPGGRMPASGGPLHGPFRCPHCGASMHEVPVNTVPANQVDGRYTRAYVCANRPRGDQGWQPSHCGHVEYR